MRLFSTRTNVRRWAAIAGAVVSIAGGLQLSGAGPAQAADGVQRVSSGESEVNSRQTKTMTAACPEAHIVVGGGARVHAPGSQTRLTQLQPVQLDEFIFGFTATAQAPAQGFNASWSMEAYAVCAPFWSSFDVRIVTSKPATTAGAFVATAAGCPPGERVLATGATITGQGIGDAEGRVGLQMVRSSGPLDIARATAREDASGYSKPWTLTSTAVCAAGLTGQHAEGKVTAAASGTEYCDPDAGRPTFVYGAGGGGGTTDSGLSWLQSVYPEADLRSWTAAMTAPISGGMVVHGVCAH